MVVGIRGVLELSRHECAGIASRPFPGVLDGSLNALGFRGAGHLRAERTHDRDFLLGEILGNEQHHPVAAIDANQGQPDSRVSSGGFDNRASRLEQPLIFRPPDDADGRPVLYAASGI